MKEANISVPVTENLVIHLVSLNSKITSEPRANPHKQIFAFRIGFYRECLNSPLPPIGGKSLSSSDSFGSKGTVNGTVKR